MPKIKISLYSTYFCIIYVLILLFLFINSSKYGHLVHLVSLGTLVIAFIKVFKNKNNFHSPNLATFQKYAIAAFFVLTLQLLSVPIFDILRMFYLLIMYMAFWYNFKDEHIKADVFLFWVIIGGGLSYLLNIMGVIPPIDIYYSPFRIIPVPAQGWRVNFGPPGSNVHFTAIISGLGLILGFHSLLSHGRNKKRWFMFLLMSYFCIFAGSRAVYLGAFAAIILIAYFHLSPYKRIAPNKRKDFLIFSWSVLILSLFVVYSAEHIIPIIKSLVRNDALISLSKSDLNDPSAGRVSLWSLHFSTFMSKPFGGGGDFLRNFNLLYAGDLVNNISRATSESYFTYLIAVYGIWSLLIFYLYALLFSKLCHAGDSLKVGLMVFAIIATAASSLFGGAYGMGTWLIIPLLSAKLESV